MTARCLSKYYFFLRETSWQQKITAENNPDVKVEDGTIAVILQENESSTIAKSEESKTPKWVNTLDFIHHDIINIKSKSNFLVALQENNFVCACPENANEIGIITQEITQSFVDCVKKIRATAALVDQNINEECKVTRKNVMRCMATMVQYLSTEFGKSQLMYLSRLQDKDEEQKNFHTTEKDDEKGQDIEIVIHTDQNEDMEREEENLIQNINQIDEITQELRNLIIEPDTLADRIDCNMEMAVKYRRIESRSSQLRRTSLNILKAMKFEENFRYTIDNEEEALETIFKNTFPQGFNQKIASFVMVPDDKGIIYGNRYQIIIRLQATSKEDLLTWLHEYSEKSCTQWRIKKSNTKISGECSGINVFKVEYRCQHNTQSKKNCKKSHVKNTNCPATMVLTLKKSKDSYGRQRTADKFIREGYPGIIKIKHYHNHKLVTVDSLRHRDVSDTTKKILSDMYNIGFSACQALEKLKDDLYSEMGEENYLIVSADRSILPDFSFCYRWYNQKVGEAHIHPTTADLLQKLRDTVREYNDSVQEAAIAISTYGEQNVICICTPFMKRIHKYWESSREICFIDSSGSLERKDGLQVYMLLTDSAAGGLPLGVIITTSKTEENLKFGLQEFLKLLPENELFYGNGISGPNLFLTDDAVLQKPALQAVFPNSLLLMGTFRSLQDSWSWLWDPKNRIEKIDRCEMYSFIEKMLSESTISKCEIAYSELTSKYVCKKYPNFITLAKDLFNLKENWTVTSCFSETQTINQEFNFVESAMRVLQDRILHATKTYNVNQLVDYVLNNVNDFYMKKLINISNGHIEPFIKTCRCYLDSNEILMDMITEIIPGKIYEVWSSKDSNRLCAVEMELGICTCIQGKTGGPCKHQAACVRNFGTDSSNFAPTDETTRAFYHMLATGEKSSRLVSLFTSVEDGDRENIMEVEIDQEEGSGHLYQENNVIPLYGNIDEEMRHNNKIRKEDVELENSDTENTDGINEAQSAFEGVLNRAKMSSNVRNALVQFTKKLNDVNSDQQLESALVTFNNDIGSKPTDNKTASDGVVIPQEKDDPISDKNISDENIKLGKRKSQAITVEQRSKVTRVVNNIIIKKQEN